MFNCLLRIVKDVVVEPVKPTEMESKVIEETGAAITEELMQGAMLWIIPVLLLIVIALCIVFIINNRKKGKAAAVENDEEQKGSL